MTRCRSELAKHGLFSSLAVCAALVFGFLSCDARRPSAEAPTQPTSIRTQQDLAQGRTLYHQYCSPCHGQKGMGDGRYFASDLEPRPSDLTRTGAGILDSDQLVPWIQRGSAAFQRSTLCPSWGHTLSSTEIGALAHFVDSLRKASTRKLGGTL